MCSRTAEVYIDDEFHMYILPPKVICGTKVAKFPAGLCRASAQPCLSMLACLSCMHVLRTCHQLVADVFPRLCVRVNCSISLPFVPRADHHR